MSYLLFLDDIRTPDQVPWIKFPKNLDTCVVENFDMFTKQITTMGMPDFICFDHDLAIEHYAADYVNSKTGYDCATWLVDYCRANNCKFPNYVVHSMNPIGKERIISYIESSKKHYGI